jgi:hypothetical protein
MNGHAVGERIGTWGGLNVIYGQTVPQGVIGIEAWAADGSAWLNRGWQLTGTINGNGGRLGLETASGPYQD